MNEADKGALLRAMEGLGRNDLEFLLGYMAGRSAAYADAEKRCAGNEAQAAGNAVNQ